MLTGWVSFPPILTFFFNHFSVVNISVNIKYLWRRRRFHFLENTREKNIWESGSDALKSELIIKQDSLSELYSETIWGSLPGCPPCWWCQGYKSGCTPRGGPSSLPGCMRGTPESAECTELSKQKHGPSERRKRWSLTEPPDYLVEFFQQPQCGNKIVFIRDGHKQRLASS